VKTNSKTLDRTKLFGFAQLEKVKSQATGDRFIDRSAKIGTETGSPDEKLLWSKAGEVNAPLGEKLLWSKVGELPAPSAIIR
jgi:hypothetical protein